MVNSLEEMESYVDIEGPLGAKLMTDLRLDEELLELMEEHMDKLMRDRASHRNKSIEEDFIYSSVLAQLSNEGLSPTHIAQMRNLCLLFIAMTSNGTQSTGFWKFKSFSIRAAARLYRLLMTTREFTLLLL